MPHESSIDLASRLGVHAIDATVVSVDTLSPALVAVELRAPAELAGVPGNDVMVRVPDESGEYVRRRYSVRSVDATRGTITLWIAVAHDGPGSRWARTTKPGDVVDLVGPRGKIGLDPMADWHLFAGDVTALGSFYRLASSIEVPGRAIFLIEVDHMDDAVTTSFDEGLGVTGIFVERQGRAGNDPAGLLTALAAFATPLDEGHAYLFGEFAVTMTLRKALLDRGLTAEQIDRKAFWRMGRVNAAHGEPDKGD